MRLETSEITSEVCMHCARCCVTEHGVSGDVRDLERLEVIYGDSITVLSRGVCDCGCGVMRFSGVVKDECPSLVEQDELKVCSVYGERPQWCRDYNCAMWAIVYGHIDSDHMQGARDAISSIRNSDSR